MNKRSAKKAISWEVLSNAVCFVLAYCVFGRFTDCLMFTLACIGVKMMGYYWHEQWWEL